MARKISRRSFIKTSVAAGGAAALLPQTLLSSRMKSKVKLGFIGTGLRGQWMLWLAAKYPEVELPAICDFDEGMITSALKILKDAGRPEPRVYKKNEEDFRTM